MPYCLSYRKLTRSLGEVERTTAGTARLGTRHIPRKRSLPRSYSRGSVDDHEHGSRDSPARTGGRLTMGAARNAIYAGWIVWMACRSEFLASSTLSVRPIALSIARSIA